jgi:hypothetical protein
VHPFLKSFSIHPTKRLHCVNITTWKNMLLTISVNPTFNMMNTGNLSPDAVQPNITMHLPGWPFTQRTTGFSTILLNVLHGAGSKSALVSSN